MSRRRALMAAAAGEDLVLSNLLTLDGILNTRSGHDASAVVWEDISGNQHDTVKVATAGNMVWQDNHAAYDATNRGQYISYSFFNSRTTGSIELLVQITGNGSRELTDFHQGFVLSNRTGGDDHSEGFYTYSYNTAGISSYVDFTSLGYTSGANAVYICWTINGTEAKRYVNGSLASTATITPAHLDKATLRIAYEYVNGYVGFPHCKIYRIGIDSRAFSADDVADRYARLQARFGLT